MSVARNPQAAHKPGSVQLFAQDTTPSGWLLCDGTTYPKATYPALFAQIGYKFGASPDEVTGFNVPDMTAKHIDLGAGMTLRYFIKK